MIKTDGNLSPLVLQALGVALLIGFVVFWVVTGHQSALLVGAALALVGVGSAVGITVTVKQEVKEHIEEEAMKREAASPEPRKGPN